MTKSDQTLTVPSSTSKEKKTKIFYQHGRDALELALSVANMQEEKTLRKVEKYHQPQVGKTRAEGKSKDRVSDKRKRLEETKVMIAKRRAEAKKEKTRTRKKANSRLRECNDARIIASKDDTRATPRKRVSFA